MRRGHEPYEDRNYGEAIARFERSELPPLRANDPIDAVISACWRGECQSIAELAQVTAAMADVVIPNQSSLDEDHMRKMRERCQRIAIEQCLGSTEFQHHGLSPGKENGNKNGISRQNPEVCRSSNVHGGPDGPKPDVAKGLPVVGASAASR
ncbi:hypothetical protein EDB81DRAFT_27024 [Dactylonectria macrodidyma]|uniref:Uncharacterized protein n=1 Tax=Dactylonectria macrodidyma TaxID=307937 RepID=A0A9P9FRD8_9HYPO|nr:hypothetical protein EDB81DRAFT_27024 [Dactylonectria macrodidyma]